MKLHATLGAVLALAGGLAQAAPFTLSSPDLTDGGFPARHVLNGFGCSGDNISPALSWSGVPAGTRSLVLMVHDPDAPTGSGFWHWTVYDIPASTQGLARGAGNSASTLPAGARGGINDYQDTGATKGNGNYGGPCPPAGEGKHRYVFTLYALSVEHVAQAAGIPASGTPALYGFVLNRGLGPAVLGKASFTATYGR
jgi:Raf kinase inhibitor-like YbhB/YbcL family protein